MLDPTTRATLLYALNYVLEDYRSGVVVEDPPVIRDKLIAAIAALEKGGEWQPVEKYAEIYLEGEDGHKYTIGIDGDGNMWVENRATKNLVSLRPDKYRLCRFVPAAP